MAPYCLLHPVSFVCFESKIHFSASRDLAFARGKYVKHLEAESQGDVWSIKPPDFSPKEYRSLSDPQNKEKKKVRSNPTAPQPKETRRKTGIQLPNILHKSNKRKDPSNFITSYRPPDALESELMFVKSGKYPSGPYRNPKPHNFRPLDKTLPDIVTTYEKDPANLKLKRKHLETWPIAARKSDSGVKETKTRMDLHKSPEPHWDARLILPPLPWPPKSATYTRHRRRRGAHSAFLDRVEEKLSRRWRNTS